jgi:uroporphyrinogen-III synthase
VSERLGRGLEGKRVVVTRAAEQTGSLVEALRGRGAEPVVLPMVAFASPDDVSPLDKAIRELRSYDWVFLTSQNAIRVLRERCDVLKMNLHEAFDSVRVAAVGPATAKAAESEGLRVSYVAAKHQGAALAEELAEQVKGKRVLLPRSDRANPVLVEKLKQMGAEVFEVCAYKTIRPESDDAESAATIVKGRTDAVLFFSPSAVHHLQGLLGHQEFVALSRRSIFAAIGPVTEGALHNAKAERILLPRDTSVSAVIEALTNYFAHEGAGLSAGVNPG